MTLPLNGWLRLWLVLTAAWLAAVVSLSWAELADIRNQRKYELTKEGLGTFTIVFSRAQSEREANEVLAEDIIPMIEKDPARFRARAYDKPYRDYLREHFLPRAKSIGWIAFAPCLALLALGWSVAWIRRGFRQGSDGG